jgi:hypothetical protein
MMDDWGLDFFMALVVGVLAAGCWLIATLIDFATR